MTRITWNENLSVGIDSIDRQHKTLIKLIDELHDVVDGDSALRAERISSVISKLINYTKVHFMYEELIIFKHISFPGADDHKYMHEKLFDQVAKFQEKLKTENIDEIYPQLMEFLNRWLSSHILKEDMKYARYVKENGLEIG